MKIAQTAGEVLDQKVTLEVECIDRTRWRTVKISISPRLMPDLLRDAKLRFENRTLDKDLATSVDAAIEVLSNEGRRLGFVLIAVAILTALPIWVAGCQLIIRTIDFEVTDP